MFPRRPQWCYPVIGRDPGLARRARYARQVPGDQINVGWLGWPSLCLSCVCAGIGMQSVPVVWGKPCVEETGLGMRSSLRCPASGDVVLGVQSGVATDFSDAARGVSRGGLVACALVAW